MLYPITLDKERNFKFGMRAIQLVEKKLQKSFNKILANYDNITMDDSATIFWAGLRHEDKTLTPEKVMDLIDEYSSYGKVFEVAQDAINEQFYGILPDEEVEEDEKNE